MVLSKSWNSSIFANIIERKRQLTCYTRLVYTLTIGNTFAITFQLVCGHRNVEVIMTLYYTAEE